MPDKPHDHLVRWVFSQTAHARGQLQRMLPPAITARIDWRTLALCPGTFIDEHLAESASDLLFSVRLSGRPALLYFLFEHQSTADRMLPFRDLAYEVRIWSWWRREHPTAESLPVIIPMLLCHAEKPWSDPTRFEALLDADPDTLADVADFVPRFRLLVDDLTVEQDAALRARAMSVVARLALWCLRHCRNEPEMHATLSAWEDVFRDLDAARDGLRALHVFVTYLLQVHPSREKLTSPGGGGGATEGSREERGSQCGTGVCDGRARGRPPEGSRRITPRASGRRGWSPIEDHPPGRARLSLFAHRALDAPGLPLVSHRRPTRARVRQTGRPAHVAASRKPPDGRPFSRFVGANRPDVSQEGDFCVRIAQM